jgi:hypothetical protein
MYKHITYLKDSIGNQYVGINFSEHDISDEITNWLSLFDNTEMSSGKMLNFIKNRFNRDGDYYHITLINVSEWKKLKSINSISVLEDKLFPKIIHDINFEGIGRAVKGEDETYFIVVSSIILSSIRADMGLSPADLHITLGFNKKDVHGVPKGFNSIIKKNITDDTL